MMKHRFSAHIQFILFACFLFSCAPSGNSSVSSTQKPEETIEEKLRKIDEIQNVEPVEQKEGTHDFDYVYSFQFKQFIDHDNKELGTFMQKVEFGFNGFDVPNVLVTEGYDNGDYHYDYSQGENEIAFLLHCNYLFVEHRYFGDSMPVEIDYYNTSTWDYLTAEQSADDLHDIYLAMKGVLTGKWVATGVSKGGITTEIYAYYHPGDMDIYVPYVGSPNASNDDARWTKFIYEEAGDDYYGEDVASQMRAAVLALQVKMMEYKEELAPRFYQDNLGMGVVPTEYLTEGIAYDIAVMDVAFGFWQYYPYLYDRLVNILEMPEDSPEELGLKQSQIYAWLIGIGPILYGTESEYVPYFIQAYQELGGAGYDFSYLREAVGNDDLFSVRPEEEEGIFWRCMFNDGNIDLHPKEYLYPKIENMLQTTEDEFILIYGTSDPYYSMRVQDPVDNPNVSIYLDRVNSHNTTIQTFDDDIQQEIIGKLKKALGVEESEKAV